MIKQKHPVIKSLLLRQSLVQDACLFCLQKYNISMNPQGFGGKIPHFPSFQTKTPL